MAEKEKKKETMGELKDKLALYEGMLKKAGLLKDKSLRDHQVDMEEETRTMIRAAVKNCETKTGRRFVMSDFPGAINKEERDTIITMGMNVTVGREANAEGFFALATDVPVDDTPVYGGLSNHIRAMTKQVLARNSEWTFSGKVPFANWVKDIIVNTKV